jgi:hypothetical protein
VAGCLGEVHFDMVALVMWLVMRQELACPRAAMLLGPWTDQAAAAQCLQVIIRQ